MHNLLKTGLCFFLVIFSTLLVAQTVSQQPDAVQDSPQADAQTGEAAEPKQYYIVEVILFRHVNEQGKRDEFWYHPVSGNDSDNFMAQPLMSDLRTQQMTDDIPALAEYDLQSKRFLPLRNGIAELSASNYKLADSAAHLRYSPDFQLLAHFGWTQRSLSKRAALPVLIKSEQFSDRLLPSGDLKLYASRYLHMQVDLAATQCEAPAEANPADDTLDDKALDEKLEQGTSSLETAELASGGTALSDTSPCINNRYRFQQRRKMRSKELHYLDNPVYGLLVYVTPFTAAE